MRSPVRPVLEDENGLDVSITSAEKATDFDLMVLVTVKIKNKTGETWDAGDSMCELSFGPEGACPDRRGTRCTSAAN
jgi:hypothetical protein